MDFKPKIRILVVDDNEVFSKLFIKLLQNSIDNYDIEVIDSALNGKECLELLKKQSYEIIFMDVEMPVMNGIEATQYIMEHYRGIRIFAISHHVELDNIQKILEAGARNYLIKEKVNPGIIRDLLKKYPLQF